MPENIELDLHAGTLVDELREDRIISQECTRIGRRIIGTRNKTAEPRQYMAILVQYL